MTLSLDTIGFYTMTDARCKTADETTPMTRGEILLTGRCNFRCPYCRSVGGPDLPFEEAKRMLELMASEGLQNVRFSGGEPLLYERLPELVSLAKSLGMARIAISSNGSQPWEKYTDLIRRGVNDFSISLDACCAEDGDKMAGDLRGAWERTVTTIEHLSRWVYTTVGVVLTEDNQDRIEDIIRFADNLGVDDIRIIPAAQCGNRLNEVTVPEELLKKYPILDYRIKNLQNGLPVRGLRDEDSNRCYLALDDAAIMGNKHYPCIIYLRENGDPIGEVDETFRTSRAIWARTHDTKADPICSKNCLDVCVAYNRKYREYHS